MSIMAKFRIEWTDDSSGNYDVPYTVSADIDTIIAELNTLLADSNVTHIEIWRDGE